MHSLDASSIVHGWDNYRIDKFPKVWEWLESEMLAGNLVISSTALNEVGHVSPDCRIWLDAVPITTHPVSPQMLSRAVAAKAGLNIIGDSYHVDGVDENDLLIISCAEVLGTPLISNEAIQNQLPQNKARYKIPAVCQHILHVPCISFLDYINSSSSSF